MKIKINAKGEYQNNDILIELEIKDNSLHFSFGDNKSGAIINPIKLLINPKRMLVAIEALMEEIKVNSSYNKHCAT